MKKAIITIITLILYSNHSFSQEVGYNTKDFGAEYNYYTGGNIFNFHIAFNSKLHHSIIVRVGYNAVNEQHTSIFTNEKGGGLSAGLGYRYFFAYRPHLFFIGAKLDYWNLNISWYDTYSGGRYKASTVFTGAETGYKFLINDRFFITPSVGLGAQIAIGGKTAPNSTPTGFTVLPGISTGVQF
jgi:hypothetical protein